MAQTLQQLGIRIDGGKDVQVSEVKEAYGAAIEAMKKEAHSPEAQRYIDQLMRTRDRLLKQLDELNAAKKKDVKHEAARLRLRLAGEIKQSIEVRAKFDATKKEVEKRSEAVAKAMARGENLSDPTAPNARIPDYDDWGWAWESGYSDENLNNKTRWTLAGWLSAFALRGDRFSDEQLGKAFAVYEKSASGWLTVDAALNYDEMVDGLDMKRHISAVGGLGLAPEAEGFASGYLAVGFAQLDKNHATEYRDYFLNGLKELSGDLNYERKPGTPDNQYEHLKGRHQMPVIGKLMTPSEWMAQHDAAKQEFLDLQTDAHTVSKNLGIEFKDPALKALLLREKGSFTYADLPDIDAAREILRKEAADHLKGVHDTLMEKHKGASDEADKMFERNKELKHFSEEDINAIKEQLNYAKKEVAKVLVSESDSFGDMIKVGKEVNTVSGYIDAISARVSKMNNEMDEEEKRRKEEEARKKKAAEQKKEEVPVVAAAAGTAAVAEKKESKETLEGLTEFLSDKNLDEEKVDNRYEYSLGRPNVTHKDGVVHLDWKNPEVDKHFGKQLNAYLLAASAVLSPKKRTELATFVEKGDYSLNALFSFIGTMGEVVGIIDEAVKGSTMKFPGRPSLSRLEKAYSSTFVPAWEKAGKKLNALVGDTPKEKVKDMKSVPRINPEVPPELQFLGVVEPSYIAVMSQIARYGNRPEGVQIMMPFSPGFNIPMHFRSLGNSYILKYSTGEVRYTQLDHVLREINAGIVHQRYLDSILRMEGPYEQYEKTAGNLDKNREGRTPGEIYLEFDWTNPDPDVYVRALPHGKIVYTVNRENVGPYGENVRSMWADNFKDFMLQMSHLRQWAEGPKHKNKETLGARKEVLFNAISNPYYFRNVNVSSRIGRIVSFEMLDNEVVRMYLDWGGGENKLSPQNALLNIWITKQGELTYTLNGPGARVTRMKAPSLDALVLDVEQLRKG